MQIMHFAKQSGTHPFIFPSSGFFVNVTPSLERQGYEGKHWRKTRELEPNVWTTILMLKGKHSTCRNAGLQIVQLGCMN